MYKLRKWVGKMRIFPCTLLIYLFFSQFVSFGSRFIPFIWVLKLHLVGVINNGPQPRSGHNKMVFWCCWNCNTAVIEVALAVIEAVSAAIDHNSVQYQQESWCDRICYRDCYLKLYSLHSLQHLYLSFLISSCLVHFQSTLVLIFVWVSRVILLIPTHHHITLM